MNKKLPAKPISFWARLLSPITKAFSKKEDKPEKPLHGVSWSNPLGARNPYPARLSMSAFASHGYVYAAVSRASQDLAALPIKLIKGRGENSQIITEHPFLDLIEQPSTYQDGFSFREQLIVDLMLSGGCYILLAGSTDEPSSLFRLHPEQTKIVTSQTIGIQAFEYIDSGSSVQYPPERIVYIQSASWGAGVDSLYGVGGVQPLQREISADVAAQELVAQSARQRRPDILISPKDEADIWDSDQRRAILDAYKGMSTQGGAMVLSGQVDISTLQTSPRDLEFSSVRDYTRQAISAVFGVPPSVLGDNSANFAVSRQQAQNYWEVQTKRGKRLSHLFTQIAKRYDPSFRVEVDYSGVEALQDVRNSQIDRISKHIINGMPPAEAYMYEGLEDAPIIPESERESEAEDIGDEEGQNVRALDLLLRSIERETQNLGKKSNAKEAMEALAKQTQKTLKEKASKHNEEYGDNPKKKLDNSNYLAVSYHRGLAAYESNPESVRPTVGSAAQWAMGRVNGLLYALRTGRYRRKPYDTDLLPKEHPLSNAEDKDKEQKHLIFDWKQLPLAPKDTPWGFTKREANKLLGENGDLEQYRKAFLFVNRGGEDDPNEYRLPIAKIIDGEPKIVFRGVIAAGSSVRGEPKFGTGFYRLSGATKRDKIKLYEQVKELYSRFDEVPPIAPWEEPKEKAKEITNFPKRGDNKEVSLSNSEYRIFDVDYAEDLKENWPEIWRAGGNIEGNNQYRRLLPIAKRKDKVPKTETEDMAIRKREAWIARHLKDFRLAGTVAQIKWLAIGSRGQTYMKELIEEQKKKIQDKRERSALWDSWVRKSQKPAEEMIERSISSYLKEAAKRYEKRIKNYVIEKQASPQSIYRAVQNWQDLLAIVEEDFLLQKKLGRSWLSVWSLTGNDELDKVYRFVNKERPLDLVFGDRRPAVQLIENTSMNITRTTADLIRKEVDNGLINGLSVDEIAFKIKQGSAFSIGRAKRIARTESTKAVNFASSQAYSTAQAQGINIKKQWLSAADDRVRETHQDLDKTIIDVNDEFKIGTYSAPSPAMFGEVEEDVNCRCTIVPIIID